MEHYQKNEVIWSGQGGTDIFFQNELPYDPPSQSAWMASPTQDGYPAFLVTRNVKTFQGYGMGSYVVFIQTSATLFDDEAFQAPDTPGVQFHDLLAVYLGGSGGDNSIINGVGGPVTSTNTPEQEPPSTSPATRHRHVSDRRCPPEGSGDPRGSAAARPFAHPALPGLAPEEAKVPPAGSEGPGRRRGGLPYSVI